MNALSSLASVVKLVENGHWGIAEDGQYDFCPTGDPSLIPSRSLTPEEIIAVAPILAPANVDIIRMHLARLALIKKIGSASELTMPSLLRDMAFELAEFSQLAVLMVFREIKRTEGAWMPELGKLIKCCERWQKFVDDLYRMNSFETLALPAPSDRS